MKRKDNVSSHSSVAISRDLKKSRSIRNNLECSICSDLFECPIVLPSCGHTFCKSCIIKWKDTCEDNGDDKTCPVCRVSFENENIELISTSIILSNMVDDILEQTTDDVTQESLELRCFKAAHCNEPNRLKSLIKNYPEVELDFLRDNQTCFFWLCYHGCDDEALLQLVFDKTNVFYFALKDSVYDQTPLSLACRYGLEDIVTMMLDELKQITLDPKVHSLDSGINDEKRTPLQWLIKYNCAEEAAMLLEMGAEEFYLDDNEKSKLMRLCYIAAVRRGSDKRAELNPIKLRDPDDGDSDDDDEEEDEEEEDEEEDEEEVDEDEEEEVDDDEEEEED